MDEGEGEGMRGMYILTYSIVHRIYQIIDGRYLLYSARGRRLREIGRWGGGVMSINHGFSVCITDISMSVFYLL